VYVFGTKRGERESEIRAAPRRERVRIVICRLEQYMTKMKEEEKERAWKGDTAFISAKEGFPSDTL
jgi:hypothetical protein